MTIIVDMNDAYALRELYEIHEIDDMNEEFGRLIDRYAHCMTPFSNSYIREFVDIIDDTVQDINDDLPMMNPHSSSRADIVCNWKTKKLEIWLYHIPSKHNHKIKFSGADIVIS